MDKLDHYNQIISNLESASAYPDNDYVWLVENIHRVNHYYHDLHYFLFCIDWQPLYSAIKIRMTTYDIIYASNCKKESTRRKQIGLVYGELCKLFNGELSTKEDLTYAKEKILAKLSSGLKELNIHDIPNDFKSKGIHEFISMFFEKLASVPYEDKDFEKSYLIGKDLRIRLREDLNKYIFAVKTATVFNTNFKPLLISEFDIGVNSLFALHVFLRHTYPYKFIEKYQSNESLNGAKIINGLNIAVDITAHADSNGNISVISKDGVFFIPDFSSNNEDYYRHIVNCMSEKVRHATAEDIADSFYNKLLPIIPILKSKINSIFSPNIIFYNDELFGIEIEKHKFKEFGIIEIGSFYPIRSEWQAKVGLSDKEYNSIINHNDIPNEFLIKRANI